MKQQRLSDLQFLQELEDLLAHVVEARALLSQLDVGQDWSEAERAAKQAQMSPARRVH